ncbi:MAG: anti-sigma factor, partial [Verrucomicrobiota bacterium]
GMMRIATLTSQLENSPISVGSVAWDGKTNRGYLTVQKLPPLEPHQDYQLWIIDPKYPQPVDGGIVRVDEGGNAQLTFTVQMPIRSIDKFAISRERRGGVSLAEGPMVLASE